MEGFSLQNLPNKGKIPISGNLLPIIPEFPIPNPLKSFFREEFSNFPLLLPGKTLAVPFKEI